MLDRPVERPAVIETTALGAAYLAGLAAGVYGVAGRGGRRLAARAALRAADGRRRAAASCSMAGGGRWRGYAAERRFSACSCRPLPCSQAKTTAPGGGPPGEQRSAPRTDRRPRAPAGLRQHRVRWRSSSPSPRRPSAATSTRLCDAGGAAAPSRRGRPRLLGREHRLSRPAGAVHRGEAAHRPACRRATSRMTPRCSSTSAPRPRRSPRRSCDHVGLRVITNNLNVAALLSGKPDFQVIVAGGVVRARDRGIVGEATIDLIRQFRVDFGIIGISGIDLDGTLLDFDYQEVRVAQAIIANSRQVFLAADHSKFGRNALVRLGSLERGRRAVHRRRRRRRHCASGCEAGEVAARSCAGRRTGRYLHADPVFVCERNAVVVPDTTNPQGPLGRKHKGGALRSEPACDLLIVGGGINGAGIARDAAGRGLSVLLSRRTISPAHLALVHQADPRRPALPRVLRVPAGARGADRARGAAARARRTSCGRCASCCRTSPSMRPAWMIRARPVPLRPSGRPRDAAGSRAVDLRRRCRLARR